MLESGWDGCLGREARWTVFWGARATRRRVALELSTVRIARETYRRCESRGKRESVLWFAAAPRPKERKPTRLAPRRARARSLSFSLSLSLSLSLAKRLGASVGRDRRRMAPEERTKAMRVCSYVALASVAQSHISPASVTCLNTR